ncbi:pilin [Photobacterium leiognathi]|uniref:pilin n=1 Tax=Photobacterium leiognathi TaxID=553611 RepID=UPI0029826194|nr:prepilin-type N-terminal cleavage/methylation domain-containing protein [Photobacterium leiognathi]
MKKQQGFTLIELMIVVAIIGVLSAIAIPAYKNYVTKGELASAVATMKALITPTELYIQENGNISATTPVASAAGSTGSENTLGTITFSAENTLQFKFNNTSSVENATVTLARDPDTGWSCSISGATATVDGCS